MIFLSSDEPKRGEKDMRGTYDEIKEMTHLLIELITEMNNDERHYSEVEILEYLIRFEIINRRQAWKVIKYRAAKSKLQLSNVDFKAEDLIHYFNFACCYTAATESGICDHEAYLIAKNYSDDRQNKKISPEEYMTFLVASLLR